MIATLEFVHGRFRRFNAEIFGGVLAQPKFVLTRAYTFFGKFTYRLVRQWGRTHYTECTIRISTAHDLPETELEDTLIHEMIHYYILCHTPGDTTSHGPRFRGMMKDINNRYGRHVTISGKSPTRQPDNGTLVIFALITMADGTTGIMISPRSRLFENKRLMDSAPRVAHSQWYASRDSFFRRYRKCLTPKMFLVEKETILQHLKGGYRIEFQNNEARLISIDNPQ